MLRVAHDLEAQLPRCLRGFAARKEKAPPLQRMRVLLFVSGSLDVLPP